MLCESECRRLELVQRCLHLVPARVGGEGEGQDAHGREVFTLEGGDGGGGAKGKQKDRVRRLGFTLKGALQLLSKRHM